MCCVLTLKFSVPYIKLSPYWIENDFAVDQGRKLLFREKYSDMAFVVDGKRIPAHKMIVLERCEYFK